ncbi:MAG: sensor histidine kinase [Candidatus Dormibacteria bacterium]
MAGPRPGADDGALAQLRAIGEQLDADLGLLIVDGTGRVVLLTTSAAALLALAGDVLGRQISSLRPDHRLARLIESCLDTHQSEERELSTAASNLVLRAFPAEGEEGGVVVIVRDETRARRLQRVRRDFVTNVSHELRTPITAIRLLVETLENGALRDPEAAPTFLHSIGLEVQHLAQMVEELLELSTIENGERRLDFGAVPPETLLESMDRLRPLAQECRVTLHLEVSPGTPPIWGDSGRLSHVVRNLVHNAIKFTSRGGTITLSARRCADGRRVELRCADTGVGIRPEDVPRIFERFWKADSSRQRDGEGSGLGLAIARHIVEAHAGSIRVESRPGKGSTFIIELPAVVD